MLARMRSCSSVKLACGDEEEVEPFASSAMRTKSAIVISIARQTRSAMLEVLSEDYVRTARAKGLSERIVILRHALKNAMIPIVTVLGLEFGTLLSGAIIAETIFAWPGLGRYLINGITGKDFPTVQGAVIAISATFVLVSLVVDLLYAALDPRVQYK